MPGESHRKAAEQHERAAHAHRVAAAHQEQGEYLSARELSRQALDHAAKAFQQSQEAFRLVNLNNEGAKSENQAAAEAKRELVGPGSGSVK
jgi:hypothetical protein